MKCKILINDHSGHPFQIQLSRELAKSGYNVIHTFSANFQTPKGNFDIEPGLESNLEIVPIYYDTEFQKYSLLKRRKQEIEFSQKLILVLKKFQPDVVISSNTPLFAQEKIQDYCLKNNIKFIFWCQDVYSIAMAGILKKKAGFIGGLISSYFIHLEKKLLKRSDHIVNITADFNFLFSKWRINQSKISVIPNWAPLEEIPMVAKSNPWSQKNGLENYFSLTYSGTLGLKHNPSLLASLAEYFKKYEDVKVIVISEGLGADFLKREKDAKKIDNLLIFPFQDFKEMPMILGASDVVVAILEPDAGVYSVPSKVLTYMSAGKPVLLSVPASNLSSKIIQENDAGICSDPNNSSSFIKAAEDLYLDRKKMYNKGINARNYAEKNFNIKYICQKFSIIIQQIKN